MAKENTEGWEDSENERQTKTKVKRKTEGVSAYSK